MEKVVTSKSKFRLLITKKSSAYKIEKNVTGFSVIKLTEYDDFFALRLFYSLSFFNVDFSGVL